MIFFIDVVYISVIVMFMIEKFHNLLSFSKIKNPNLNREI